MFKNQSTFITKNENDHEEFSQEKDFSIENIPVHTMAKDIQEIENPSLAKTFYAEKTETTNHPQELSEKQKSSPFLVAPVKPPIASENRPKSNPDYSQINKAIQPNINNISVTKTSSNSNVLTIFIVILITLFIGTGTYYFVTTRQTSDTGKISSPTELKTKDPANTTTIPLNAPLSAMQINHIVIDIVNDDKNTIKKTLEKKAQEVMTSNIKTPVEFIIVDKQNNPVSFSNFATITGLTLSEKTMSELGKDFSLFFLNDNGNIGFGLDIKVNNSDMLKNQLSQEETLLYKELAILLPYTGFAPPTVSFQVANYKNNTIRYQNLISYQKLSIDYVIKERNLLIATTKLSMELLLDKTALK